MEDAERHPIVAFEGNLRIWFASMVVAACLIGAGVVGLIGLIANSSPTWVWVGLVTAGLIDVGLLAAMCLMRRQRDR